MQGLLNYLILPAEITAFERKYLERMNRITTLFFVGHIPVFTLIAAFNKTGWVQALGLTSFIVAGPLIAGKVLKNPRHRSVVFGLTAMALGGLLVHYGQGPMQIEMHFYFFVLIALLAVFANPLVIIAAAVTVALHHLVLWLVLPESVFNYEASIVTVLVHALFVVLESVAACFVARSFFDDVIGLERIVERRTEEVRTRNEELRLVFNTIGQGFVTIDREGRMSAERSAVLSRWLGEAGPDERLSDVIARTDAMFAMRFDMGWDALLSDVLPLELAVEQMPKRVICGQRVLEAAYTPIMDGEVVQRMLVVLTDVTAQIECERAEAEQRDLLAVIDRVQRDRQGLLEFVDEGEHILERLGQKPDEVTTARLVHTLKGNAGLFGLSQVADACHAAEDDMAEAGGLPSDTSIERVRSLWGSMRQRLAGVLGDALRSRIELDDDQLETLIRAVESGASPQNLVAMVRNWRLEPAQQRLERIAEQAQAVANRLGRDPITVDVQDGGVRLLASEWAPFWGAFVHVVRNALDHGIEYGDERAAKGKTRGGKLTLTCEQDGADLVIAIADDGRGVDWGAVKARAEALGLPTATRDDLIAAMLRDGLSTRTEVTAYSGRGVGMGSVLAACKERGGTLTILSQAEKGMIVCFRFPNAFGMRAAA